MDPLAKHRERCKRWPLERIQQKRQLLNREYHYWVCISKEDEAVRRKRYSWLYRVSKVYADWHYAQTDDRAEQQRQYDERWNSGKPKG